MSSRQQIDPSDFVEQILKLRRMEAEAHSELRAELSELREFLEDTGGPTISRAKAARALGISQTALDRWIGRGELAVVTTPTGRREVPLSELVDLLLEVDQTKESSARPVASVMRNRRRRADADIDLDRLLPQKRGRTHKPAELHSLAYHRLVAERLDDVMVERARRRLRRWIESERIHPTWADAWNRVLSLPLPRIAKAISTDTVRARELRQSSPFAGLLTEHERRRLRQAVEARAS